MCFSMNIYKTPMNNNIYIVIYNSNILFELSIWILESVLNTYGRIRNLYIFEIQIL